MASKTVSLLTSECRYTCYVQLPLGRKRGETGFNYGGVRSVSRLLGTPHFDNSWSFPSDLSQRGLDRYLSSTVQFLLLPRGYGPCKGCLPTCDQL